jgi:hypothetical protein
VVVVLACGVVVHVNELFCVLALLESCCEIRIAFGAYAVVDEFSAEQVRPPPTWDLRISALALCVALMVRGAVNVRPAR